MAELIKEPREPRRSAITPSEARAAMAAMKGEWRSDFVTAIDLLAQDLKGLGHPPKELLGKLQASERKADEIAAIWESKMREADGKPLFKDVAVSHWAWSALHDLKDEGIFVGFPDRLFGG